MIEGSQSGVSVFISYVHEDEDLKKELDKHLKVLKRSSKIQTWNDRELLGGQERDQTIMSELNKANIILLLISVDFIASDSIWDNELKSAMKRHEEGTAYVVPIILRKCDWSSQPYTNLQALPRNATPVTEYPNRDDAFTEIAKGVEDLVDHILKKSTAVPNKANTSHIAPIKEKLFEVPVMPQNELRKRLGDRLSVNEVKQVAFDLDIDYENLEGSEAKTTKIMALIAHVERRNMTPRLFQLLTSDYPHVLS